MGEEKKRIKFSAEKETIDYLDYIKEEQGFSRNGDAIAYLIADHKRLKKEEWSVRYVSESVTKNLYKTVKEELKRIRLGTNNTDRNTQIILEVFNGLMLDKSIPSIITTDILQSQPYIQAKEVVQDRIQQQELKK